MKQQRRLIVKQRLEAQLVSGVKQGDIPLTEDDRKRIKGEIKTLELRLSGVKKEVKSKEGEVVVQEKDKWMIDIYSITYSRVKRSERRKNKGKSRKKMKIAKSVSLVKSVVAQPGMIENYRQGRAGISPKTHKFTLRKEEPFTF